MAIYVPWILTVCSLVLTICSLGWAIYLKGHSNRVHVTDRHDRLFEDQNEKIRQLELAIARQSSPLMKQVQDLLTAGLHHPDPAHSRTDALLEKLDQTQLTAKELPELVSRLDEKIHDPTTPTAEIEAAKALQALMPLVVKEHAALDVVARTDEGTTR